MSDMEVLVALMDDRGGRDKPVVYSERTGLWFTTDDPPVDVMVRGAVATMTNTILRKLHHQGDKTDELAPSPVPPPLVADR